MKEWWGAARWSGRLPSPTRPAPLLPRQQSLRRWVASREALLGRFVDARVLVVGLVSLPLCLLLFVRRVVAVAVIVVADLVIARAGFARIVAVLVRSLSAHALLG